MEIQWPKTQCCRSMASFASRSIPRQSPFSASTSRCWTSFGVTYTQYLVLSALWERDGLTIGAVAERLALEPSTITPAVKRLEAAGFVARQRSTTDERQVQVHLSRKGASLHAKTGCLTAALLLHSGFTVPEMIELNRKVQLLRDAMRQAVEAAGEAR